MRARYRQSMRHFPAAAKQGRSEMLLLLLLLLGRRRRNWKRERRGSVSSGNVTRSGMTTSVQRAASSMEDQEEKEAAMQHREGDSGRLIGRGRSDGHARRWLLHHSATRRFALCNRCTSLLLADKQARLGIYIEDFCLHRDMLRWTPPLLMDRTTRVSTWAPRSRPARRPLWLWAP